MIKRVPERSNEEKLTTIKIMFRDFVNEGSGLEDSGVDFAMLIIFSMPKNPEALLKEAYCILKPEGKFWCHILELCHSNSPRSTYGNTI